MQQSRDARPEPWEAVPDTAKTLANLSQTLMITCAASGCTCIILHFSISDASWPLLAALIFACVGVVMALTTMILHNHVDKRDRDLQSDATAATAYGDEESQSIPLVDFEITGTPYKTQFAPARTASVVRMTPVQHAVL
ncbi:hypothetical protein F4804DRAFT_352487 [Jackrogersella minutella]|nr:hypothetical protein F4804DRAFT_352487 [Jackrogersella minutella]